MNITIDSATPRDASAIAALRTQVAEGMTRQFGPGHWSGPTTQAQVMKQLRASQVLVARCGDGIIGTVRLASVSPAFDATAFTPVNRALYVLGLAVAPESRKSGVGGRLMDAARRAAQQRGAQALWLDAYENAAGAGPFYLRRGFRRVGPAPGTDPPLTFYEQSSQGDV